MCVAFDDFEPALSQAQAWHAQVLIVMLDSSLISCNVRQLADLALKNGIPSSHNLPWKCSRGFTLTYGPDNIAPFARGAYLVDRILRGAMCRDDADSRHSRLWENGGSGPTPAREERQSGRGHTQPGHAPGELASIHDTHSVTCAAKEGGIVRPNA